MSLLALAVVLVPALSALAVAGGLVGGARAARISVLCSAAAFLLAAALAVVVTASGPVAATVDGGDGPGFGLYVDRLGAVLLLLVLGIGTTVQGFASRYLAGDVRIGRFFWASSLLAAATAALVTASTLVGLALGWTVAGAALCVLLTTYPGLPEAAEGARRTRRAFLIGDGALWVAVAIALATWGDLGIATLGDPTAAPAAGGTALTAVAALIVVAALARSAQVPFGSWLPATLAAPTPVSALLHAGVVNAGGILLVRLAPVFGASALATHLAFAAGAVSVVYGTALMLTRADVKGSLAFSTTAQMGFMLLTCGVGAYAATIFHLVGHGMYKACLFLGSGGAVRSRSRAAKAPPVPAGSRGLGLAALAAALPAAALALAVAVFGLHLGSGELLLLGFALASGFWLTLAWLRRRPAVPAAAVLCALGAFGYVGALSGFWAYLEPALAPAPAAGISAAAIALVMAALAVLALLRRASGGGLAARLGETAYVWALAWSHLGRAGARPPALRSPGLRLPADLVPRSQGAS